MAKTYEGMTLTQRLAQLASVIRVQVRMAGRNPMTLNEMAVMEAVDEIGSGREGYRMATETANGLDEDVLDFWTTRRCRLLHRMVTHDPAENVPAAWM